MIKTTSFLTFKKSCLLLLSFCLLVSCKQPNKAEVEPIETTVVDNSIPPLQFIENPAAGNAFLPRLYSNGRSLFMSWVHTEDSVATLNYSKRHGTAWSQPITVASGTDWFVNWADFPTISENNGAIFTNILQRSADGTYTYDIKLNLFHGGSTTVAQDAKASWFKDLKLHNDTTKSEHGFVSLIPYLDNSFMVSWLDGRNTSGMSHGEHDDDHGGAMTLRAAVVHANGTISNRVQLDDRVCDCCGTSMAMTEAGPVVVYRDRSEGEVRDISIVRYIDDRWTTPQTVAEDNWEIPGCPVNGPAVSSFKNILAVAWFTAAKGEGDVQVAFSEDNGAHFGHAFRIDVGNATGRVDIVMINEEDAAVLWMEPNGENDVIQLMKINKHGYTKPLIVVSSTAASRASGFPQLELVGDHLYCAWTLVHEQDKQIKTATIAVSDLDH